MKKIEKVIFPIVVILLCGLLLPMLAAWAIHTRPRRDPAQRLWQKALRQLARRQVDCAPWEAPLSIAHRVAKEQPEIAEAFARVTEAYLLARYGGAKEHIDQLRRRVAQLP